jgi:cobyrinic acid a,c-diamide synthase
MQGVNVAPFKKGPDYIDAAWLTRAAGAACRNLDLFLMSADTILDSFSNATALLELAVIEGNRGLYDGMDAHGSCSTAELAKLLAAPVILVVDCTKTTRTIAAQVLGCQHMDPEIAIRGVVLNRVGGVRHEQVVRSSIEQVCGVPVVGAMPRLQNDSLFRERHLGLVPPEEHGEVAASIRAAGEAVEKHIGLDAVREIAMSASALSPLDAEHVTRASLISEPEVRPDLPRIGVFRDTAFQFYYPENLEALVAEGAELVEVSPICDEGLPDVDGLYIGGGFPETLAVELSANSTFRASLAERIESGLPVYAECGGAVYLGERLYYEGSEYPMVGVLPVTYAFDRKPRGHGYTELEAVDASPFYEVGERIRGHEFHYTYMHSSSADDLAFAFRVRKGHGFDGERDGICRHNVLACYTHVHALGTVKWAPSLVRAAAQFREKTGPDAGRAG